MLKTREESKFDKKAKVKTLFYLFYSVCITEVDNYLSILRTLGSTVEDEKHVLYHELTFANLL
jgi:hypothetical protein